MRIVDFWLNETERGTNAFKTTMRRPESSQERERARAQRRPVGRRGSACGRPRSIHCLCSNIPTAVSSLTVSHRFFCIYLFVLFFVCAHSQPWCYGTQKNAYRFPPARRAVHAIQMFRFAFQRWFFSCILRLPAHARMISCAPTAVNTMALSSSNERNEKIPSQLPLYTVQMAFLLLLFVFFFFAARRRDLIYFVRSFFFSQTYLS